LIEADQADAQGQGVHKRCVVAVVQFRARQHLACCGIGFVPFQSIGQTRNAQFPWRILNRTAACAALQRHLAACRAFGHALHWRHAASTAAAVQRPRS